ncbi:hypothetical protein FQZ97_845750 [compost metagenome]
MVKSKSSLMPSVPVKRSTTTAFCGADAGSCSLMSRACSESRATFRPSSFHGVAPWKVFVLSDDMDNHLPGVVAGSPVLAHFFTCVIFPPALSIQRSASEVLHESGQLYFNEEASKRPPK